MEIESRWIDGDGNAKFNSWQNSSENPSTANSIVAIMRHKLGWHNRDEFDIAQLNANKHLTNNGRYLTNDYDHEKVVKWNRESGLGTKFADTFKLSHTLKLKRSPERFSHDEVNAITSSCFYFLKNRSRGAGEWYQHSTNLWILEPNSSQIWYRPFDVGAALKYARNPEKNHQLIWQMEFFAKRAFNSTAKDANGNYHASGKVQAWIRCVGLGLDLKRVTNDMPERDGLVEMFANFFVEKNHLINEMARKIYKGSH